MQLSSTSSAPLSEQTTGFPPAIGGRYFALAVLFSMNLLNYVDRYTFFAVGTQIQRDLHIGNSRLGFLNASFMIVYTMVSPLVGWLGDRYHRRGLLAFGVGLWSLATVGTAFAHNFSQMFFWRGLLGVGEASYGVIAPALLADLFPAKDRGRVMGLYYLALPLGGALGYGIGGWVGDRWGWPSAFWVVGLPGLLAAIGGLLIADPGRGASDGMRAGKDDRPRFRDYLDLFRTPTFVLNTAGMAAVTFATGGYAAWGSTFYQTVRGMSSKQAGLWIGGLTAAAGLLGIALGTWAADFLLRYTRRAYLLMASVAVLIAIPFGTAGILDPDPWSSLGFMFGAMVLLAAVLGPCNAVTANVVPANRRAAGYAMSIFLLHLLGDISSPILIGSIADGFARPGVAHSWLGTILTNLGAARVGETNLTVGMLSVVPVLMLGCIFFLVASRHLAGDQERARKFGGNAPED
jgi:MFS transporter, Spinster family, sphingosine-1-phosphate transporter